MKKYLIINWILIFYMSACSGKTSTRTDNIIKDTTITPNISPSDLFPAGKVIDSVVSRTDPAQSYALYIPQKGNKEALPVIYFFDPHAAGALPLNKYRLLADKFGFILIGSNNSKNGNDWSAAENIWRDLFNDTQGRLKINSNRIYTCGFSGGAKVAGYVALNHQEVKGIIAIGAGLPDRVQAGEFKFSFTAVAGRGDMNMTDLVAINNELDRSHARHRIIFFEGKHEWAPEAAVGMAFAGLQFDAMAQGIISRDKVFIDSYIAKSKKRSDLYFRSNQLIKVEQECAVSLSFLDGVSDETGWFREKIASLTNNPVYVKQRQAQENVLVKEQNMKAEYMQHFQQNDMSYWIKTIRDLQTRAAAKTAEKEMYQRLLAYLSLAFYSISNQLINSNQNNEARHFVELYKMADAMNSEAWYFSAILNARDDHAHAVESDLVKAVELGFNDESRLMKQPEFKNLSGRINFSGIENRMHNYLLRVK